MAATVHIGRDTGPLTSGHGTTRYGIGNTSYQTSLNFCLADDPTVNPDDAPMLQPVSGSSYSMPIYLYLIFSGSFAQISNCKVSLSGTYGTGVSVVGKVTSTYATPATTALSGTSSLSTPTTVLFSTSDPSGSTTTTLTASGFSQYIVLQMSGDTTVSTNADTGTVTVTVTYDER